MKKHFFLLILSLTISFPSLIAQEQNAIIEAEELTYDFGNIVETEGPASHTFVVKNTGNYPLLITRVTASCGCTTPEWTQTPMEPGSKGEVKVTYDPKGRPGPFRKSVSIFSNGNKGAYRLIIMGNVITKPPLPAVTYPYGIDNLKMSTRKVSFNSVRADETLGERMYIKNEGSETLVVKAGKLPNYLSVEIRPEVLQPEEAGEITLLFDAKAAKKMGRVVTELPLSIESLEKKQTQGAITVAANILDNFSKLSSSDKAKAPVAEFSSTHVDFGVVEEKGGFKPIQVLGGKSTSESFTITNKGKTNLTIYSVSSDNDLVDISGGKKELKPGASVTYKVSIKPKEIKTKLDTNIHVVSNDPNGPVRLIRVTAEK